jgi:hypothetical protein
MGPQNHPTNGIPGFYDAVIGNDILGSCTLMVVGPAEDSR